MEIPRKKIIQVKVKPGSGREEIKKISEKQYLVWLKKPAEDNKANIELIKLLRKYFSKYEVKNIKIIKGLRSRNKIIEVS